MNPIIPAIMPQSYSTMEKQVERVYESVEMIQLDIMDGIFVPEKTWPFKEVKGKFDFNSINSLSSVLGVSVSNSLIII